MKSTQLAMFFEQPLAVPKAIRSALEEGAALAVSISGGKDSQALLNVLSAWFRVHKFSGQLFAIHADLGRAEWPQTPAFVEKMAKDANVPLLIVQRKKGDLVSRIDERLTATREKNKPFWPSAANRYCTSELKRNPIDRHLRGFDVVISAEGVRADESPARAKKPVVDVRTTITSSSILPERNLSVMTPQEALSNRANGQRVALNWRPLLHWSTEQVWRQCGTTSKDLLARQWLYKAGQADEALAGWPAHPAYVIGNERLSCSLSS